MEILITCKFYFNKADFLKRALEKSFVSPSTNPTFKDSSAENPRSHWFSSSKWRKDGHLESSVVYENAHNSVVLVPSRRLSPPLTFYDNINKPFLWACSVPSPALCTGCPASWILRDESCCDIFFITVLRTPNCLSVKTAVLQARCPSCSPVICSAPAFSALWRQDSQ